MDRVSGQNKPLSAVAALMVAARAATLSAGLVPSAVPLVVAIGAAEAQPRIPDVEEKDQTEADRADEMHQKMLDIAFEVMWEFKLMYADKIVDWNNEALDLRRLYVGVEDLNVETRSARFVVRLRQISPQDPDGSRVIIAAPAAEVVVTLDAQGEIDYDAARNSIYNQVVEFVAPKVR